MDIPKQLVAAVVFDQSVFVKEAILTVLHEGLIGLVLTSLMILIFLGSLRATSAVLLSIPLSALTTFVILSLMGSTVNTMILGGWRDGVVALFFQGDAGFGEVDPEVSLHQQDEGGALVISGPLGALVADRVDSPFNLDVVA